MIVPKIQLDSFCKDYTMNMYMMIIFCRIVVKLKTLSQGQFFFTVSTFPPPPHLPFFQKAQTLANLAVSRRRVSSTKPFKHDLVLFVQALFGFNGT